MQVQDRFPEEEMAISQLFYIFDVDTYTHLSLDQLDSVGEHEIPEMLEMLSQENDGSKKFFCREPFIDISSNKQEIVDNVRPSACGVLL
jgi:hypothetical protein